MPPPTRNQPQRIRDSDESELEFYTPDELELSSIHSDDTDRAPRQQSASAAPDQQPARSSQPARRKQANPKHRLYKFNREMLRLQSTPGFLLPRLSFSRVVREIMLKYTSSTKPFCITKTAMEALQASTEMYLTQRFQDAYLLTSHRSRVTVEVRDMALVAYLCKSHGLL